MLPEAKLLMLNRLDEDHLLEHKGTGQFPL